MDNIRFMRWDEFKKNLPKYVEGLGIDVRFLDNPAFSSMIHRMLGFGRTGTFDGHKKARVSEKDGCVFCECTFGVGDTRCYTIKITSTSPSEFSFISSAEVRPDGINGEIDSKFANESIATISEDGSITFITNAGSARINRRKSDDCYHSFSSSKSYYTSYGILRDYDYASTPDTSLGRSFDDVDIELLLEWPRKYGLNIGFIRGSRASYRRNTFDTARVEFSDGMRGKKFNGIFPLRYDLREMNIGGFEFSDVQDIFIPQLSREEIEERIQREDNPKVREGLRMLAEGRENYSYDSRTDEHYVNTFANETKGRGR